MNYVEWHLGDYESATAHLTILEDGIYGRLLRVYYRTEQALPADQAQVARLVRASTKLERDTVGAMLEEFFELCEDGWHNRRADTEISRYREKQTKARRSAEIRWDARRQQSDCNADASIDSMRTHSDGIANGMHRAPVPRHQTPDSNGSIVGAKAPTRRQRGAADLPTCPADQVVELYHQRLPTLPRVRLSSEKRARNIRAFWAWVLTSRKSDGQPRARTSTEALAWISEYFERAASNDFLMGRGRPAAGHEGWRADFDFLLTERGRIHVIERTGET